MRIFYITNARIPTEKAHGLATVKLCEAFAKQGVEVMLVVPRRLNSLRKKDPYEYYAVERNFKIKTLPSIDFLWLGLGERVFFLIQLFSFSLIAALWLWVGYGIRGKLGKTIIFSHDHIPLYFVSFFALNVFYDIHHYPEKTVFYTCVLQKAIGVAVQTKWKVQKLKEDFGVSDKKIIYWPNGTEIRRFDITLPKEEAKMRLNLPGDKKIVLYTGQLFRWKGVETLVESAKFLPQDVAVYIVGGNKQDIERLQALNPIPYTLNLVFIDQRPWTEMPLWLKAADVLVIPNTGKEKVSQYYTSPMKLFEYMASGRPVVASDIPSIREIVDDRMVFFARPDDPRSFAEMIQRVLAEPEEAKRRSENACMESRKYTWEARAEKILEKIQAVS